MSGLHIQMCTNTLQTVILHNIVVFGGFNMTGVLFCVEGIVTIFPGLFILGMKKLFKHQIILFGVPSVSVFLTVGVGALTPGVEALSSTVWEPQRRYECVCACV